MQKVRDIYGADSKQMTYARESMKSLWQGLCAIADTNKVCINLIKLNLIIIYVGRVDNSRRMIVDVKNYQSETNTCMVH